MVCDVSADGTLRMLFDEDVVPAEAAGETLGNKSVSFLQQGSRLWNVSSLQMHSTLLRMSAKAL